MNRRHINRRHRMIDILAPPQRRNSLEFGIEKHTSLAIKVQIAQNRAPGSREREHGKRYGNGHVDAHLANVNLGFEPAGRGARGSKDGSAVAVRITVYQGDGVVERIGVERHKDGGKDFLLVAVHVGLDISENGGACAILDCKGRMGDFSVKN
ncbi:hypothetical protein BC937DRAFT_87767 [Endogone sp. FLAS-F59071]|nr:hypothetical protein BC937DRAFT_87767 [Endogone sp. FLAS-F59071]|eukprot:RUS19249.1 hypothetical protein BC937DRAFT_87767 [Endogone sp. FLAS-F59071]